MPARVALIGATGSIGIQALEVIGRFPDQFELAGAVSFLLGGGGGGGGGGGPPRSRRRFNPFPRRGGF